jgi:alkylation response protein AidB-like acyl-CoA dehydrogenase
MSRFDLTEDQIAIRDMARGFASDKLAPNALTWDEHKHFPVDVLREAAALGMGGIYVREDVGGSGREAVQHGVARQLLLDRAECWFRCGGAKDTRSPRR